MSYLLKNIYSPQFYENFLQVLEKVVPTLDKSKFKKLIFNKDWSKLELKDRMRHTAIILHQFLDSDFKTACRQIITFVNTANKTGFTNVALECMFLPEYVERYGKNELKTSLKTIEKLTEFSTCEFAIRPFILAHPVKVLKQMQLWSNHKNHHVRRLSCEGCRPMLPWSMALPFLKKDPSPVFPILENLRNDPTEYVQKSVANHINDISKNQPEIVLSLAKKWIGEIPKPEQNSNHKKYWILKHGLRTLLKKGDQTALTLMGWGANKNLQLTDFKILTPKVKEGDYLTFAYKIENKNSKPEKIRIEYALYFLRGNGEYNKKVFMIKQGEIAKNQTLDNEKKYSFKPITTRRYYKGIQKISIIINGVETDRLAFELVSE